MSSYEEYEIHANSRNQRGVESNDFENYYVCDDYLFKKELNVVKCWCLFTGDYYLIRSVVLEFEK